MNDAVKAIFDTNLYGTLATVNEDGSPWATPLHVVADDEALYWFSLEDKVHSENIARDARVSATVFTPSTSEGLQAVYARGEAELLDAAGREVAYELFRQRLGSVPPVFEPASAYRLPVGRLDEEKSTGNCWYFYS